MKMHSLYRHFDKDGVLLYVGVAMDSIKRLSGHRHGSHWFSEIASVTIEWHETRAAVLEAERKAVREENPLHNIHLKPVVARKEPKNENKTRGRKTISKTDRTVSITVKMGEGQRVKFRQLGGSAWVRAKINRAKVPE